MGGHDRLIGGVNGGTFDEFESGLIEIDPLTGEASRQRHGKPIIDTKREAQMKYGSTVIFVDDVAATVAFYEKAFGFQKKFHDEKYDFAIIDAGGSELGISSYHAGELMMPGRYERPSSGHTEGVEIAFYTSDVAGAYERAVAAGAASMAPPREMPWGQTVAYVRSLEGIIIGFCTPISPDTGKNTSPG